MNRGLIGELSAFICPLEVNYYMYQSDFIYNLKNTDTWTAHPLYFIAQPAQAYMRVYSYTTLLSMCTINKSHRI